MWILFLISIIFSSIGVCCPEEISDKANVINLPANGEEDPIIWGLGEDNNIEGSEAIISRPEERGWCNFY